MSKMRFKGGNSDIYVETVGILTKLTANQGFTTAWIGDEVLVLPNEMEDRMRPLIGMNIGLLHTDLDGREWLIRVITGLKKKTALMTDDYHCEDEQTPNCCEAI